jgi:hypothetical protein
VPCGKCDRGRIVEAGFDGRIGRECGDCHDAGEIALTAEEAAIVGRFLVACRIAVACGECGHHRDLHDDGECPPVLPFPMRATLPPAA